MSEAALLSEFAEIVGTDAVRRDEAARSLAASDLHLTGEQPLAVIRPANAVALAAVVATATANGIAVLPRGGGLNYTGGYTPPTYRSITIDLRAMNRILDISTEDMVITVQAGVTWKQMHTALKPLGLRLPFIGPFSGAGATVGGGLGHGALFFGSARYGSAAEIVLGMQVALADGSLLRTGQGALAAGGANFLRTFGPDLTGLFTHDGGMFGIKTEASFRLIHAPANIGFASFSFAEIECATDALSAIARADLMEEVYLLDPVPAGVMQRDFRAMVNAARLVARDARGFWRAVRALAALARGGIGFIPAGHFSLHMTAAGRCRAAVAADLAAARNIAVAMGGRPAAPTIPRVARAELFQDLNAVLGTDGARWAALNAKVAHSDARALIAAFDKMLAPYLEEMAEQGVTVSRLASALANHCFSFEPVFHWRDNWLPIHFEAIDAARRASLTEPAPAPQARALVDVLRCKTVDLFQRFGAASNQIGRTYPFRSALSPPSEALLSGIKAIVDPRGLMNPGVLGF